MAKGPFCQGSVPRENGTNMTIKQQRESLPVFAFSLSLSRPSGKIRVLIVVGETGSGKTTQLTQYLAEGVSRTMGW